VAEVAPLMNDIETAAMFCISTRHMKRLVEKGEFPAPIRLGGCIRWSRKDIQEWIAGGCMRLQKKASPVEVDQQDA